MADTPILFYRQGTCALGSIIALEALNQPYQLVRLERGENDEEPYLSINPLGEVPTLLTSDGVLTESLAILHHIGSQAIDQGLSFPQSSTHFDRLNQVLSFLVTTYHKSFGPLFGGKAFHLDPKIQEEIKKNVIENLIKEELQFIDQKLLSGSGLFFENMTIADAYFFGTGRWAKKLFSFETQFPNIARFFDRMNREEAVKAALAIEEGRVKEAKGAFQGHVPLQSLKSSSEPLFPGLQTSFTGDKTERTRRSGAV